MRVTPATFFAVSLLACTRGASTPTAPVANEPPPQSTIADRGPQQARRGDNPVEELMERAEGVSEFAPTEAGLTALLTALTAAVRANDTARLGALVEDVLPARSQLLLALTFDGGRTLGPYLSGPAGISDEQLTARAREWATAQSVTVRSATGAQIAAGANATAYNAALRTIGPMLREGVSFYRAEYRLAGGRTLFADCWVYAGAKWMFVPEPWRFAPGSPDRATVSPSTETGASLPSGGLR